MTNDKKKVDERLVGPKQKDLVWKGMSQEKGKESEDAASDTEYFTNVSDMIKQTENDLGTKDPYDKEKLEKEEVGDDSPGSDAINTESAPYEHPENIGEQEISGSATDPASDDDALLSTQNMGQQQEETPENPEEIDIARDLDKAEKNIRES